MFLLFYLGPALLTAGFCLTRRRAHGGAFLFLLWLLILATSAAIGALSWQPSNESTQFAEALLPASPVLLLGPLLLGLRSRGLHWALLCLLAVVVPTASVAMAIWFILATGQIWGM